MENINVTKETFLRLMELARDNVKTDDDLQKMLEICTKISNDRTIVAEDYHTIFNYMKNNGRDLDELEEIRRLGGF